MNLTSRSVSALILVFLLADCSGRHLPVQSTPGIGPFAERVLADRAADWITFKVPGASIHVLRGSAAEADREVIAQSVSAVRSDLLALLGDSQPIDPASGMHLFFVNSRDDTRRLAGAPLAGFIQEGEPTGVFVYTPGYRLSPLLRHELTHLYTFELWGTPRAGRWFVEGVGAWAAGDCQGHSLDALAAGALARGALVPIKELATRFRAIGEEVAMPQAGSIVGFLIRRRGLAAVKDLWKRETSPAEHPLGSNGATLEKAWLEGLASVRPATLDVSRILREGC